MGRYMLVFAIILGFGMCAFAIYRDYEEDLIPVDSDGGVLLYQVEQHTFGFNVHAIQEWLPSLVLLIWSLPLSWLIKKKGGLKWFKSRWYLVIPLAEIFEFASRLMPQDYATQVASFADLLL